MTTLKYVHTYRGEFVFRDYGSNWSTVARNLDITLMKAEEYRGVVRFSDSTVTIQNFKPMSARARGSFKLDGTKVVFDRLELVTDGAATDVTGMVDMGNWPEQLYNVKSRIQFPRMREIFFASNNFSLHGEGDFTGTFHLFKGGRELKGDFHSREAGLNYYRFPELEGSLVWLPEKFEVTRASSRLLRRAHRFHVPDGAARRQGARLDVRASSSIIASRSAGARPTCSRPRACASLAGRPVTTGSSGRPGVSRPARARATSIVTPPPGVEVQGPRLPDGAKEAAQGARCQLGPFSNHRPLEPVGIGGHLTYSFDGEAIRVEPSELATAETYVAFEGATAWGDRSKLPFRVTSTNWQESDRLLAGIMTAFGATTKPSRSTASAGSMA